MEDMLIAFDKLTSAKQTEAVATLIKEGGKFLDLDDILSAVVETFDLKAVVERIDSQPTMTAKVRREHNLLDAQIENKLRELGFLENKGVFWRCNDDKTATIVYHSAHRFMHPMDNLRGWELENYPDLIQTLIEYGLKTGVR